MKKYILSLLALFSFILCAWTNGKIENNPNSNTWSIQINGQETLAWTKNKIGDEAKIKLKSLKQSDILHAQRYLCGQDASHSTTILTLKNSFGKTLKQVENKTSSMIFQADMPLKDVLPQVSIGQTIKIYFTIKDGSKSLDETILLGQIKLE